MAVGVASPPTYQLTNTKLGASTPTLPSCPDLLRRNDDRPRMPPDRARRGRWCGLPLHKLIRRVCFLRWRVNFARTATNVAAALASPVAFLTDANCDADKGFFASATTCNAGSRSLAMAFRAQCFCWHLASCAGSGGAAVLVAGNLISR
jgi:hypothetical protein